MIDYELRTRRPHPHITEEFRSEKALRKRMHEQKSVYFLEQPDINGDMKPLPNLDAVMRHSVMSFEEEIQDIQAGDKSPEEMRKYVFFFEGIPGSGKTYNVNDQALPYLKRVSERMRRKYGINAQVRYLQWDHIEDALGDDEQGEGVIHPVIGQPFSPTELRIAGSFLELLTAYALRDDNAIPRDDIQRLLVDSIPPLIQPAADETQSQVIERMVVVFKNLIKKFDLEKFKRTSYRMLVVEKNTATAIKTKNGLVGKKREWTPVTRQYFPDMLDDLHYQEGPFKDIDRDSLFTTAIGVVGGPSMEVLIRSRELLGKIGLDAANELYTKLGLPPLREEQKNLAGYGGSMAQIAEARKQIWPQLLRYHNVDEIVRRLPPYIQEVISLKNPVPSDFPASAWDDPLGKELIWQAVMYSKLFEPTDADEQNRIAIENFLRFCFRLAEASLLMNNLLEDENEERKVNHGTIIFNNPLLQLTEEAWGIFANSSS